MSTDPKPNGSSNTILVESERLLVRQPENGDIGCLTSIFCDPEMMRYLGGAWTPDKVAEVLDEWRAGWGIAHRWTGILVQKETGELVGTAGLTVNTIEGEPGCELSWFVLPNFQGQGFASEITATLLRFAFDTLGADRVVAETHPENPASNRVLEKLGFACLGECSHQYDDLPGFETQVLWALTRDGWKSGIS